MTTVGPAANDRTGGGVVKHVTANAGHAARPVADDYVDRVRAMVRSLGWYLPGCEVEDLEQEAMVGLMEAVTDYDAARGPFWPFARFVVLRQLMTMLRLQRTRSRDAFHFSQRVFVNDDGQSIDVGEAIADPRADPHALAADRETLAHIGASIGRMTPLERRALLGVVAGYRYDELGDRKRIDNAIGRARIRIRAEAA